MIKVTVEKIEGHCNMPMLVGDHFFINGSKLSVPQNKHICIWALQSMMPVFPLFAEKDKLKKSHWITNATQFSCPDPKGRVIFRLEELKDDQS